MNEKLGIVLVLVILIVVPQITAAARTYDEVSFI